MPKHVEIAAIVHSEGGRRRIIVSGRQVCRTLVALITAGNQGITALEVSSRALRLAHYIWRLKTDHGLLIETEYEPHEGGHHGRYRLISRVTLDAESEAA
jgi:hypothetical protein